MEINYHISELKYRVSYILISIIISSIIAYEYKEGLVYVLAKPILEKKEIVFVYTGLTEAFITYIKLSIITGTYITVPLIVISIYRFLKPGWYEYEKEKYLWVMMASVIIVNIGQIWYWVYLGPVLFKFFMGFMHDEIFNLNLMAKIGEFINFVSKLIIVNTMVFSVPGVLLVSKTYKKYGSELVKYRHYVLFIVLLISGFLTPPDIVSQIMFGLPIIIMFELTYILSRVISKYEEKEDWRQLQQRG